MTKNTIKQRIEKAFSSFNTIAKKDGYRVEFLDVIEVVDNVIYVEFKAIYKKHFFSKTKTYKDCGAIWPQLDGSFDLEF